MGERLKLASGDISIEVIEPGGVGLPEAHEDWCFAVRNAASRADPQPVTYGPLKQTPGTSVSSAEGDFQLMAGWREGSDLPPFDSYGDSWRVAENDRWWVALGRQDEVPAPHRLGG